MEHPAAAVLRNSPFCLVHMVTVRDTLGNSVIRSVSSCAKEMLCGGLGRRVRARFKVISRFRRGLVRAWVPFQQ